MECRIISSEREVFSGDVKGLFARGVEGWVGILSRHAPAVFALVNAPVRVVLENGQRSFHVRNGLIDVRRKIAIVLGDEVVELA